MNQGLYIVLGLAAGILSGVFGIGGGIILIPVLIYCFAFSQQMAQGTTLAAMIQHRNETQSGHILTIEDPLEYMFRHGKSIVNQREVLGKMGQGLTDAGIVFGL